MNIINQLFYEITYLIFILVFNYIIASSPRHRPILNGWCCPSSSSWDEFPHLDAGEPPCEKE